jgi:hypothetical protein
LIFLFVILLLKPLFAGAQQHPNTARGFGASGSFNPGPVRRVSDNPRASLTDARAQEIMQFLDLDEQTVLAVGMVRGGSGGGKAGKDLWKNSDALGRHNKVFRDVVTKLKLDKRQRRILHDIVTKEGMGYHEILQLARDLFNK